MLSVKDGVGADGLAADGADVALVQVAVLDAAGIPVPVTPDVVVTFAVTGAGALAGTGSGDPADHANDKSPTRVAFHGPALAVVRSALADADGGLRSP